MSKKLMHLLIMYHEVHRLDRAGFNMSYISRYLVIDRRTVKKILSMSEEEYLDYKMSVSSRSKKLDSYEDFVRSRLEACPEASSAQVHDWLREHHEDFMEVNEKTVFNFVLWVRQQHGIPKPFSQRAYQQIEQLAYGYQAQVDFGQYNMKTEEKGRKKVHFLSMVLSRSRQKYVVFQPRPFTTLDVIDAHEKCFAFYGGIPEQVVYDQDKLLLVDENKGHLILTGAFRKYVQYRDFKLHFCRKSDPQSKGKVENVIKYIKYNFLRGRTYVDIDTLNGQVDAWLYRTANAKVHAATHKIPQQEWLLERDQLKPFSGIFSAELVAEQYTVRKDNTISYKGNFYELPLGTYQGSGTTVGIKVEDGHLLIYGPDNKQLARYQIYTGKGRLIGNSNFRRDYTQKIDALINEVSADFADPDLARQYFEQLRRDNPRYIRDQLGLVRRLIRHHGMQIMNQALNFCLEHNIFKATDMESLARKLALEKNEQTTDELAPIPIKTINQASFKITPQQSDISDYQNLMN